jgi:orotate phosphoribosyltransferase
MQRQNSKIQVAKALLKIGAVGFLPEKPITFKSGLISPVYIDNRKFPFHPKEWQIIIKNFANLAKTKNINFDCIAGIESAGIPHSAALGYYLKKPSVFTRKNVKDHGTKKMVEGGEVKGKKVLLIEDHVTTGFSSLLGVKALRSEGAKVTDCFAITSYEFSEAKNAFKNEKVKLHTLTDFSTILSQAEKLKILNLKQVEVVKEWLIDPWNWAKKHGFEKKKIKGKK